MRYTLVMMAMCLLGTPLLAQRKNDVQQQYLQAKSQFQQEQWVAAMENFRQIAANPASSGFAEYASFYYAISAINAGRREEAKAMLLQLRQKSPDWEKQEEVSYWLGRVYLEDKNWQPAVAALESIRSRNIKADAADMARFYLQRDASVDQLKKLLDQYPDASYVADALARKISAQSGSQDQALLQELIKRYKLDKGILSQPALGNSEMKDTYSVAVMLPFMVDNLQPEKNIRDLYFTLDLYEGMKLAQQDLALEGIRVSLLAYDTRRDSLTTVRYLRAPEMQAVDLIVGPIYPGPTRAALEFAYNNRVNLVNPISTNPEVIQNNPYAFLFKPSLLTLGQKAADFAGRTFSPPRSLVIYGGQMRDSLMAFAYKQELERNGFSNIRMERIKAGDEKRIRGMLVSDTPEDTQTGGRLSSERIGHVFIASEEEIIVATAMNAIASRKNSVPVIGHESWIRKNLVSNDQLERLGVYLLAPEYIDYSNADYFTFRDKYLQKVHSMPTNYAFLGYDLLMYYGRMMHRYGNLFQTSVSEEVYHKGILCERFNYQVQRDNQCVPIIQFKNYTAVVVYQ